MSLLDRSTVIPLGIVIAAVAAFGFFVYLGSTLPTQCGTVPCGEESVMKALDNNLQALSDYFYGVTALLIGQVALLLLWLTRSTRQ